MEHSLLMIDGSHGRDCSACRLYRGKAGNNYAADPLKFLIYFQYL